MCIRAKIKGDDSWACIVLQLLHILSDASNTFVGIIYIYQHMHINCIKLYVIHEHKPLLQASTINHHPQRNINTKAYTILIHQFTWTVLKMYNSSYKYNSIIDVLILCFPLHWCQHQDGNVMLKHVGGFMFVRNLKFYTIFVHVLVYINDYNHDTWYEQNEIYIWWQY